MKKVKKLLFISLIFVISLILTGCTKTLSFTYKVETGDTVKIQLETDKDYKLSSKLPFKVTKDDETLSTGTFLTLDGYETYKKATKTQNNVEIFEENSKGDITYTFFSINDEQFIYLIKINDSKTGLFLENTNSKDEAQEVFKMLTITIED